MTEVSFNKFYKKYHTAVEAWARGWVNRLKAFKVYSYYEPEDVAQEIYEFITTLPEGLDFQICLELGKHEISIKLAPKRLRSGINKGRYIQEFPVGGIDIIPRIPKHRTKNGIQRVNRDGMHTIIDIKPNIDFENSILLKIELSKRLSDIDYKIWNLFLRKNRELNDSERKMTKFRFKHFTGWTNTEIANSFGITRQAIEKRIKKIINTILEVYSNNGDEKINEERLSGSK